jgi:indolepyruvate ferredoxin oxidoreductase
MERQLIRDYEGLVEEIIDRLTPANHEVAVALAEIPEHIRGFGHVKERHLQEAKRKEAALLARLRGEAPVRIQPDPAPPQVAGQV